MFNLSRVRQVHDGVNKMNCNAAGCKQGRYEETSNRVRGLLIEVSEGSLSSPRTSLRKSNWWELARTPLQRWKI